MSDRTERSKGLEPDSTERNEGHSRMTMEVRG